MNNGSDIDRASTTEFLPGFSSLGFRIRPDAEHLGRLLEGAAVVSDLYPAAVGEAMLCCGEYYRLWQNFSVEDAPPVLECSPLPGMVAFTPESQSGRLIKAYLVDPMGTDDAQPTPVCFGSPHYLLGTPPPVNELRPLSLTMLAGDGGCMIFDSAEALAADPRTEGWPTPAFAAIGMFDGHGNELKEPTTQAFLTGHVLLGVKVENSLTAHYFWALRVRSQYGEIFVCLPNEALDADPTGKVIGVMGKMTGSFPDLIPEKIAPPEEDPGPGIDNEAAEARIRELTLAFMKSDPFDLMFSEIHPEKYLQRLATGVGLFNKNIRDVAKNLAERRQLASPELRQRYVEAARTAPIVFAHVVMANTMMLESGQGSPALVVLAWGDKAMETMSRVRRLLSRVHFGNPENEDEARLAAEIADEEYHFGRRRPMPYWLTGGEECYAADLWVSGAALDEERLRMEVIVCFAEPGPTGLTMAIPGKLIKQALFESDPSTPKPPPLPKAVVPPPLPPHAR